MTARGIRNNNPGNIRRGDNWDGLADEQNDKEFCVFESMPYGIRAMLMILKRYAYKYRLLTTRAIITRWAPACENDTYSYINHVSQLLGVMPDTRLDLTHRSGFINLAKAIARHECGKEADTIPESDWEEGAIMAGIPERGAYLAE